jgi:hypothetical protein
MASNNLLDTKTLTLNDILGNGKIYKVPQFQRDYAWEQDNIEDIWHDLMRSSQSRLPHYMGAVVLQTTRDNNKELLIIDGQQRFSTLSILILALIAEIKALVNKGVEVEGNQLRMELLMTKYIGQKDAASLSYSSKLFLNENNDGFYQSNLLKFRPPVNERKLTDSEQLLWNAYKLFRKLVAQHFENKSGEEIATFINDVVGELLVFIQITVQDELNAYTVFETLNSRGEALTTTDLLKNYLFSLVAPSPPDLRIIKEDWKKVIDIVGLKEFPVFLRYYLMATHRTLTKDYLFKEIKTFVQEGSDVFDLLRKLTQYAYYYKAAGWPEDEYWNTDRENRKNIAALQLFRTTQWKPLLMVAMDKLPLVDFKRLLTSLVALTYRYSVIGKQQTNRMEEVFSKAAIRLFNGTTTKISEVLNDIKDVYLDNDTFKQLFEIKTFNSNNTYEKRLLRYTLYHLEAKASNNAYDADADDGTIEHILPESFPPVWQEEFSEEEFHVCRHLLGNFTLLEPMKNSRGASDFDFDTKKQVYQTSKYQLTRDITASEWRSANIRARQAKLAKMATNIWWIAF